MLSGVRSEAEERNEASAEPFTTFEDKLRDARVSVHIRVYATLFLDMIERNLV